MIATHNIKVNGRWYHAGEEYTVSEPEAVESFEKQPEDGAVTEAEPVKTKRMPSRRKASN